ncbi:MAG: ATP-binding protein [Cyanobacteria bacterium P01_H01_bin.121]
MNKLQLQPTSINLKQLLQDLVAICNLKAAQKQLVFVHQLALQLPYTIEADGRRLRQMLLNLLSNAIKFTETGSITLSVELLASSVTEQVTAQAPHRATLRFQVEDTGIGIAASELKQIFLPFEQVGKTIHSEPGTGLGLAISQRLAKMMGSQLSVTSEVGQGSRFWFDLEVPILDSDFSHPAPLLTPAALTSTQLTSTQLTTRPLAVAQPVTIPNRDVLRQLQDLTLLGAYDDLTESLTQLQDSLPQFTEFSQYLLPLAQRFASYQILAYLQQHL